MRFSNLSFIFLLLLFSFNVSAQQEPFDVGAKMNELNRLLKESDPDLKRFDQISLDNGNIVIWNCHKKKSTNCFKQFIPFSKLSIEKLKVVKHKSKPKSIKIKSYQILITSNGKPAVTYTAFKGLKKEYRITVESKERGEQVTLLLKEILAQYTP